MLPAAASLCPGQPEAGGDGQSSPHKGKLSPQGSTQGPDPQGGGCPSSGPS